MILIRFDRTAYLYENRDEQCVMCRNDKLVSIDNLPQIGHMSHDEVRGVRRK